MAARVSISSGGSWKVVQQSSSKEESCWFFDYALKMFMHEVFWAGILSKSWTNDLLDEERPACQNLLRKQVCTKISRSCSISDLN